MAVPRSDQENDFMASLAPGSTIWVACSDRKQEGVWKCEGPPKGGMNYTNWISGQPDNFEMVEHCVTLVASDNKWNDRHCDGEFLAVCKQKPRIHCFTANNDGRLKLIPVSGVR